MKVKVVVVGGGPAGFSAATTARKAGAEVTVLERTDMLGGLGLVAGLSYSNYAYIPVTEAKALGGAELYDVFESITIHSHVEGTPQGGWTKLYNVTRLDSAMQKAFRARGIEFMFGKRVVNIDMVGDKVSAVVCKDGTKIKGDVFIDTTGATTGIEACERLGYGCVSCILRCPSFGNPGGIVEKKVKTVSALNDYGKPTTIGTSVMIAIESVSPEIRRELREKGFVAIPVPKDIEPDTDRFRRAASTHSGVADMQGLKVNMLLHDIGGFAKVVGSASPMYARSLRSFPGLEDAMIFHPGAGARGHLVWQVAMAYRDNALRADGFVNVFCAGTKCGPQHSLIDAAVTGDLAGHNAVRCGLGQPGLELPKTLAIGAYINHVGKMMRTEDGLKNRYGVKVPELLKSLNVFRQDEKEIAREVEKTGLVGVYQAKLVQ
ncbi:MAG: FAD-dependent oxidoreductase [Chloroflexota bacterium]|nr:FAD-dependent oxidoreductase [Chloroflexota bacterium]